MAHGKGDCSIPDPEADNDLPLGDGMLSGLLCNLGSLAG
jgi:hypothetical protein